MFQMDEKKLRKIMKNVLHNPILIITSVAVSSTLLICSTRLEKKITINDNGKTITISTYKAAVKDVLSSADIKLGVKDKIIPSVNSGVTKDMIISIKRAVPIEVAVDGKDLTVNTAENTVSDMLKAEGIVLNEKDKISPSVTSTIDKNMNVKIIRVVESIVATTETVPYSTVNKLDDDIEQGVTKTVQNGEDGEKEIQTKIVYEDGKEVSRNKVGETLKKSPIDKIIAIGTLAWFTASRGDSAKKIYYTRKMRMRATSYTSNYSCTGKNPGDYGFGITSSGTVAKRAAGGLSGWSTVAVDPSVIPLGTKLYIEGYGLAIAEDTGGGVKGNSIDLYFDNGEGWSTRYVNVYLIKDVK